MIKRKLGFTLIELLVVLSIISLLTSVVLTATNKARSKARDAIRVRHASEMRKALELYYLDNGARYPVIVTPNPNPVAFSSCDTANWSALSTALQKYLPKVPTDPKQSCPSSSRYVYISNGSGYKFEILYPENPKSPPGSQWYDPTKDGDGSNLIATPDSSYGWMISTPGAEGWY